MTNGKHTIFYAIQVSNFTVEEYEGKKLKKWVLRNDACTNIAVGIIQAILEKHPEKFHFIVKVPFAFDTVDVKQIEELFENKYLKNIEFYQEDIPISPINSRYNFDFNFHTQKKDNLEKLKRVDVMINDENTLTKNWRAVFREIGNPVGIVSTNYFLDSPIANKVDKDIRYYERQMESFTASDIAAFQCEAGRLEAMEAYDMNFKSRKNLAPQSVWGVGASSKEINKHRTNDTFSMPTIYFGNRISDSANRYTNYHAFAEAIGKINPKYEGTFRAVMLNPTRKVTKEQLNLIETLSKGRVEVLPNNEKFTREDYLHFIHKAHISCNLFVTEVHGGVTHVEAMLSGNYVIMPKVNNYKHKFDQENYLDEYSGFCEVTSDKKEIDVDSLTAAIEKALDMQATNPTEFKRQAHIAEIVALRRETYEGAVDRIVGDLDSLLDLKTMENAVAG